MSMKLQASIVLAVLGFGQGAIHTVGGLDPDFPDVQSAINAAASGDVILVRDGSCYTAYLDGTKSLTLLNSAAAPSASAGLAGPLEGSYPCRWDS